MSWAVRPLPAPLRRWSASSRVRVPPLYSSRVGFSSFPLVEFSTMASEGRTAISGSQIHRVLCFFCFANLRRWQAVWVARWRGPCIPLNKDSLALLLQPPLEALLHLGHGKIRH